MVRHVSRTRMVHSLASYTNIVARKRSILIVADSALTQMGTSKAGIDAMVSRVLKNIFRGESKKGQRTGGDVWDHCETLDFKYAPEGILMRHESRRVDVS